MAFSQGKARSFHVSMAVACTLLASGGFVGAGYAENSLADSASAAPSVNAARQPSNQLTAQGEAGAQADAAADLTSFPGPNSGIKVSFANMLILARKPQPPVVLDLTDPHSGETDSVLGAEAMLGGITALSPSFVSQVRKDILAAAFEGLGHSYVWGGTSFSTGWDCSGFVQWAYAQAGVALPRTEQWVPMVKTTHPQPGDMVAQNPDGPGHWSHVGIYVGNGLMISALNPAVGTIMAAPELSSNSSTYFTMSGFASLDEKAAQAHAAQEKAAAEKAAKEKAAKEKAGQASKDAKATAGASPSKTDRPTPTETAKASPTPSPSATERPSPSPSSTPTPRPSPTPKATPIAAPAPSATERPSPSPSSTPTPTPSPTPKATPTASPAPGSTPTAAPAPTSTATPAPASARAITTVEPDPSDKAAGLCLVPARADSNVAGSDTKKSAVDHADGAARHERKTPAGECGVQSDPASKHSGLLEAAPAESARERP